MSDNQVRHPGVDLTAGSSEDQDQTADIFGFRVFLMSDAVIFALLFATYATMLSATAGGPTPTSEYRIGPAFAETLILLTSSFTFGLALIALKYEAPRRQLIGWLTVTLLLGLAFLGLELNDFREMIAHGAVPARSGYLSSFFALVPLHGLHVLAGCIWLVVMMAQIGRFGCDDRVKVNLVRLGLFWHFLDIVWIAMFSLVFLQGLLR